jgi:hypothetical protein
MAVGRCVVAGEEGLRRLIHSVLDSNSKSSDFSEDETESEKGNSDMVMNQLPKVATIIMSQILRNAYELRRTKSRVTGSGNKLTVIP